MRRAGRRPAQRPLLGDRRPRPQRDAPTFVSPELDDELGIAHGLTPESLAAGLDQTPEAVGAMVVSPTYFGACADVAGLAEVAHARGVPLIVDEAWGAHLHFHPALPPDALACGADLVTSSTHKIVGSLTQAAMLHLGEGGRIDPAIVDRCVSLVETTSPSGLLTGSLDAARRQAQVHGSRAARRDARGGRRDPRGDRLDPRPRGARRRSRRPARGRRLGPAAARDRRARHRHARATGWPGSPSTPAASTSSSTRRTWWSRSSASASPPRRPASGWSAGCARWSASSRPNRARPTRSSLRRRPGASWR